MLISGATILTTSPTSYPIVLWAIVCDYGTRSIGSRGYPRRDLVQPRQTAQGDPGGPARVLERSRLESTEVAQPSGYFVCSLHSLARGRVRVVCHER
jgi:hypothetical protein